MKDLGIWLGFFYWFLPLMPHTGAHDSKTIFKNIRSYLQQEWQEMLIAGRQEDKMRGGNWPKEWTHRHNMPPDFDRCVRRDRRGALFCLSDIHALRLSPSPQCTCTGFIIMTTFSPDPPPSFQPDRRAQPTGAAARQLP